MEELQEINVLYEDNHLLVVVKPSNVPVCADNSGDYDFLSILKDYLKKKYNKPGNVYLGLVHRLDRPVSGIMVFAKTSKAASRLSEQVRMHSISKTYYAVVEGKPSNKGTWQDYLFKDEKRNMSFVTSKDKGKEAILHYEVIDYKEKPRLSLVKIRLVTGRSHQIRVQFSSRGYPLIGDQKYNKKAQKGISVALFAGELEFYHPVSKEKLSFKTEIPDRYPFGIFK